MGRNFHFNVSLSNVYAFLSLRLIGRNRLRWHYVSMFLVSIPAPLWGAMGPTDISPRFPGFLSLRPYGAQRRATICSLLSSMFIFLRPYGAQLHLLDYRGLLMMFISLRPTGRNLQQAMSPSRMYGSFISLRPYGAQLRDG